MIADWERLLLDAHGTAAVPLIEALPDLAARLPESSARLADVSDFICGDPAGAASLRTLSDHPDIALLLMRLAGISRYAFEVARRIPGVFWQVVEEGQHAQVWGRRTMSHELDAAIAAAHDEATRTAVLARFKHRHWLRILLGEACGLMRFESIVTELSDATDALAAAAVRLARTKAASRGPVPAFTVLGMGKLGARELNYSSDIDLIFLYEPDADSDLSHSQARRVGESVIRLLEGGDGDQLFRVDMRLRPEGERGELALSLRETIDYYWSVGRPWERQAMLKARVIAGDPQLGERLVQELRPWVFPQEPRWEDLEESRMMRRRIEERAHEDDVKTGAGGIRDIEFLAQHFQLLHGGRLPELRIGATLPALRLLADRGILPRDDAVELERHLIVLRTIEHRLQCWEDRQEHAVPSDRISRTALAHRCGFSGSDALTLFDERLSVVRARVRELAARHYLQRTPDQDAALALLVQGESASALAERMLSGFGFTNMSEAVQHLRALATEPFFILARARTERALLAILPEVLRLVAATPDPDRTLNNLTRIAGAVGGRAVFYELLAMRPRVLQLFVSFAGMSDLITDLIEQYPGLPDEVADALARPPPRGIVLHAEARALIRGLDEPGQVLGFLRARELAVAAARDLQGEGAHVPARLSLLAEVLVSTLLHRLISDRAKTWGIPEEAGRPSRFCVIALGKLGGREMSWGSDCDVLLVSDPGGTCPRNGRDGETFWDLIAKDLCRTMQEAGLGEVDLRLRPWGDQGPLVATLPALEHYWHQPREVWERMANLRASYLAGDPRLAEDALSILRGQAISAPMPADGMQQVAAMRVRLEESVAGEDNLKRGPGGYVDAEFLAQALMLGRPAEDLPQPPTTAVCLRRLADCGVIPMEAATVLIEGLGVLRGIENRLRLADGRSVSALPIVPMERLRMARRCGFADIQSLDRSVQAVRTTLREWFLRLIKPSTQRSDAASSTP